ncbi:hypothetical protein ACVOMT_17095 [Sphingomonas panni]
MVLADEARAYFNDSGQAERALLDPMARVVLSCEIAQDHDPTDACHRVAADPACDRCGGDASRARRRSVAGAGPGTGDGR